MAKKAQTPQPPRRPKGRGAPAPAGSAPAERRTRLVLLGVAAAGLVGLAVALAVVFAGNGGGGGGAGGGLQRALSAAGCTFASYPASGQNQHVTNPNAKPKYNSFPPTSGKHYFQAAPWNSYPDPVPPAVYVHNLEHGGVVIQYGDRVPQAQVDALQSFRDDSPNGLVVAPFAQADLQAHPRFRDKIALAAWNAEAGQDGHGRLAVCPGFDERAFTAFRDAYRGKGPERIPLDRMAPGQ